VKFLNVCRFNCLQKVTLFFAGIKGSQPLKNRARGFFFSASNCKNLSGKTVLKRNQEGQQLLGPKSREQSGKNRWAFDSFDASEKVLLESFLHVNELFYLY